MNFDKLVEINDKEINVLAFRLGAAFTNLDKELLYDVFTSKYHGQKVIITALDGENLIERGVVDFFEALCQQQTLRREDIEFRTHDKNFQSNFDHQAIPLNLFWGAEAEQTLDAVALSAKFVGTSIGRFTPTRLRLAYEIDCAFGHDSYIIFQPKPHDVDEYYTRTGNAYAKELAWLKARQFEKDSDWHEWRKTNAITQGSYQNYHRLWPHYKIEIIAESDVLNNYWFTEKISRCIVAGKPFVLLAGAGSLKNLQRLGFVTFDSVIDESYDQLSTPRARIAGMIQSLVDLYHSSDRDERIEQLNKIAQINKKLFPKLKPLHTQRRNYDY